MANWEPHPPRSSSRFPAPGIFFNVEFGVMFRDRPHTATANYTSRRMQERLNRQRREQDALLLQERNHRHPFEQALWTGPHPSTLTPGSGDENYRRNRHQQQQHQQSSLGTRTREPYQQTTLSIRTRDPHERGSSAPPYLTERPQIPLSPISPITSGTIMPIQHTSSMPLEGYERPLPALPSQYRLGEDSLPWSTEPWYRPDTPENPPSTRSDVEFEPIRGRGEDPQRVRDLEELHQAMMTVDSIPNDDLEPWVWESVGETPRGPRSLGWAVSSNDTIEGSRPASVMFSPVSPPPPYVVSQWESSWGWNSRPRSSGT